MTKIGQAILCRKINTNTTMVSILVLYRSYTINWVTFYADSIEDEKKSEIISRQKTLIKY
jgi:hypothetical protein